MRDYGGKAVSWIDIHHQMCGHCGEMVIAGYPVDGFCLKTNTVFQFHVCRWHGCPTCYPTQRKRWAAFEKTNQGKGKLTRDMRYARTLERRKAILEAGFELVECCEHNFHEKPIYLKKKTETFLHAVAYIFEAMLPVIKSLQATKDLLFKNEHLPVSVSLADTLNREPEHIISKDPEELVRKFWEALVRRAVAIREDMQRYIPEDFNFFPEQQQ